jgi:5'-nucleotidase (lipoprotein e(P4) family)
MGVLALVAGIATATAGCGSPPRSVPACTGDTGSAAAIQSNVYDIAVAWRATSAEREMLYRQNFNVAHDRLTAALASRQPDHKPLAVVTDIDDTVLDSNTYWNQVIGSGRQAFDDGLWDDWVENNGPTAAPGAVEFLDYATSHGVEVFYISSRDQGENTQKYAIANLAAAGLPFADPSHVTMLRDSSDKEPAQRAVEQRFSVPVMLGDNLNDFKRVYYGTSVSERRKLAQQDAAEFGRRFIVFPNPTDGHWVHAIFGESEPADTPDYHRTLRNAAQGS